MKAARASLPVKQAHKSRAFPSHKLYNKKNGVASPPQLFNKNAAVPPHTSIMLSHTALDKFWTWQSSFFFYPVTAGYLHKSKQELSTGQHTELQAREEALSNDPCPSTSHATTLAGQSGALSPYYPLLSISDPMQPLVLPPGHFKSTPQPCSL